MNTLTEYNLPIVSLLNPLLALLFALLTHKDPDRCQQLMIAIVLKRLITFKPFISVHTLENPSLRGGSQLFGGFTRVFFGHSGTP